MCLHVLIGFLNDFRDCKYVHVTMIFFDFRVKILLLQEKPVQLCT
jgi:hypothetical protein